MFTEMLSARKMDSSSSWLLRSLLQLCNVKMNIRKLYRKQRTNTRHLLGLILRIHTKISDYKMTETHTDVVCEHTLAYHAAFIMNNSKWVSFTGRGGTFRASREGVDAFIHFNHVTLNVALTLVVAINWSFSRVSSSTENMLQCLSICPQKWTQKL